MAGKNGNTPTKRQLDELPLRLPVPGVEVTLGVEQYHLATLTTWGARELQEFIRTGDFKTFSEDATDSIGTALVNGAISLGNFDALGGLARRAVYEPVDEQIIYAATPDQLVALVDALFASSGVLWLTRILKNSLAETAKMTSRTIQRQIDQQISRIEERLTETPPPATGTESPLTSSTAS